MGAAVRVDVEGEAAVEFGMRAIFGLVLLFAGCSDGLEDERECCDCLVEFRCIEVSAETCVERAAGPGGLDVEDGCIRDEQRCGVACAKII